MTPSQALDLKRELLQWLKTSIARDWFTILSTGDGFANIDGSPYTKAVKFAATMLGHLRDGAVYVVSPEMFDLAQMAGQSMPSQALVRTDIPSESGVIFFPGIVGYGKDGLPAATVAVSWSCVSTDYSDESSGEVVYLVLYDRIDGVGVRPVHMLVWPVGESQFAQDDPVYEAWGSRTLLAAWTLMQQPIAAVERGSIVRPAAKRARRAGLPNSDVSVIRLRRAASDPSGEPGAREYHHRWIVRGHWRNQYLPSRKTHRLQWITEHVKGPEDKPLKLTEKVYSWQR